MHVQEPAVAQREKRKKNKEEKGERKEEKRGGREERGETEGREGWGVCVCLLVHVPQPVVPQPKLCEHPAKVHHGSAELLDQHDGDGEVVGLP